MFSTSPVAAPIHHSTQSAKKVYVVPLLHQSQLQTVERAEWDDESQPDLKPNYLLHLYFLFLGCDNTAAWQEKGPLICPFPAPRLLNARFHLTVCPVSTVVSPFWRAD